MRHPAAEKLEIIRTVEASHLPVKRTLSMIGIPSSTFYDWYARWADGGVDALADQSPRPRSVWNRIPETIRRDFVEFALEHEDLTAREAPASQRQWRVLHRGRPGRLPRGQGHGTRPRRAASSPDC
jgi:transposase-like protein